MKYMISTRRANKEDLESIISFLSQPEINEGFCKPLSDRDISITERVHSKYKQGVWVIATVKNQIGVCLAVIPDGKGVTFSTFACKDDTIFKLAARDVWEQSLKLAIELYDAAFIEVDSWEGNKFVNWFLVEQGFEKISVYPDPDKRTIGVNTVLYRISLNSKK